MRRRQLFVMSSEVETSLAVIWPPTNAAIGVDALQSGRVRITRLD
jgi:hypothetical protein